MTTPPPCDGDATLESCLLRRLTDLFGRALPALVLRTIAHELAAAAGAWLRNRARNETFDSRAELVLRAAANEASTSTSYLSA